MSEITNEAIKEAKRIEEDALFTSRSNFIVGLFWSKLYYRIGIPTAILSVVAGATAITKYEHGKEVAAVFSMIVAILAAINTFLNPQAKAALHKNIGNSYNSLRNRARLFYNTEARLYSDDKAVISAIMSLSAERDKLNKDCPHIPDWAFKAARKGIEEGQAKYEVDS